MSRARSSRASAVKARGLFKELANEDDESGKASPATSRSKKRKKDPDDDDDEFDASQVPDEASDEEIADENVDLEQQDVNEPGAVEETGTTVVDSNEVQRRRNMLLDLWTDFIEVPVTELREISAELRGRWKKQKKKKYSCPERECSKSFTTIPGVVYHYKRCGISTETSGTVKCKLCGETALLAKKLLYHLFNDHLTQLPHPPEELTVGLAAKKPNNFSPSGKSRQTREYVRKDCIQSVMDYRKSHEQKNLFPNRMPLRSQWVALPANQCEVYIPLCDVSASFKLNNEKKWQRLNRFEAVNQGFHRTFFTGGTVFSAAWAPTPTTCSTPQEQVLALSVGLNLEDSHAYSDQDAEHCMIQFWTFGRIKNDLHESGDVKPHLSFGVGIADGIVWGMEWCPFGNSWMSPTAKVLPDHYPRLGLICLACGNGVVKILSIPHIKFVASSKTSSPLIFMPSPVMILDPPGVGPLTNHEPCICKCISWSKTSDNKHIAAGFGSGAIAVWNIETQSRFLKTKESTKDCDIFLPNMSFTAHGAAVNALCWCPYQGSMILVSGSGLDRDLVFWDLTDLRSARRVGGKKAYVTSMEWPFRWHGVFISQDAGFTGLTASVVFVSPVRKDKPNTSTCMHRSTVWSASYNEWCNVEASGDASGEVVAYRDFDDVRNLKLKLGSRTPIYRVQPEPLSGGQHEDQNVYYTYDSMVKHFGMEFRDVDLSSARKIRVEEATRIKSSDRMSWQHPSNYPLVSVNHVAWNPNKDCYTWLLTGGQCGVCRISCVSLFKQ